MCVREGAHACVHVKRKVQNVGSPALSVVVTVNLWGTRGETFSAARIW